MNTNITDNIKDESTDIYFKSFIKIANWIYAKLGAYISINNINSKLLLESLNKSSNLLNVHSITLLTANITNPLFTFCELVNDLEVKSLEFNKDDPDFNKKKKELESSLLQFCYSFFFLIDYLSHKSLLDISTPFNKVDDNNIKNVDIERNVDLNQENIPNKASDNRIPSQG